MATTNSTQPKPRKLRGWATYEGDEFTFKPSEEGKPSQLNVRTCRGGKLFTTTSAKAPQQVAHLTCPADSPDPYAEYLSQLKRLGVKPQKPEALPTEQRLVSESGLECWLDTAKGSLTFTGTIDLQRHSRDWQAELLRQVQLVVRRMPACDKFNKVIDSIKKGGNTNA